VSFLILVSRDFELTMVPHNSVARLGKVNWLDLYQCVRFKPTMRTVAWRHELRLAVGQPTGPQSSIWRVWSNGNEVYASVRSMAAIEKLSFHQSGICRRAFTEQYGNPSDLPDRATLKWKRATIKPEGFGQCSRVVMLGIPTDSLSAEIDSVQKPIIWIKPAPAGKATYLEFAFTREDEAAMQWQIIVKKGNRKIIDCLPLPNGNNFVVLAHYDQWDDRNVLVPASHHENRNLMFSSYDPNGTGWPMRVSIFTMSKDNEVLMIRELGGYPISNKELSQFPRPFDKITRNQVWARKGGAD
jgi:hypothetical protein